MVLDEGSANGTRVLEARPLVVQLPVARSTFTAGQVRTYYDRNTSAFVRHGQGGEIGAIHRAVWGPGVRTRADAFRYIENLIAREIDSPRQHVVDLGCGVGASLIYLAAARDIRGTGVTLSPVQARLGQQRVATLGLTDRVRIIEGDYTALPADLDTADLAYAIESFVHGPSPERFFSEAARILRSGGTLILCDDVRAAVGGPRAHRTIARFTRGWHVNSLLTPTELSAMAKAAGFTQIATTDLTPHLELRRPRDRAIAVLAALTGWLPGVARETWLSVRLAPLLGGSALQTALANRWIEYHFAVFRKGRV
ncbi:MAG TPA: class I SAM-dependent methyltransferase [Vicinamibacterales bacterium]|nr:class I SAM-dependent methyltransferase [Vicinamibacterales bacterium]